MTHQTWDEQKESRSKKYVQKWPHLDRVLDTRIWIRCIFSIHHTFILFRTVIDFLHNHTKAFSSISTQIDKWNFHVKSTKAPEKWLKEHSRRGHSPKKPIQSTSQYQCIQKSSEAHRIVKRSWLIENDKMYIDTKQVCRPFLNISYDGQIKRKDMNFYLIEDTFTMGYWN